LTAAPAPYHLTLESPTFTVQNRLTPHASRAARVLASLALLAIPLTFLAAQIDFARRNHIGISPERYWRPQLMQIWLPGLGLALALGVVALVLHRRSPRA
jgi:hypothetical protein